MSRRTPNLLIDSDENDLGYPRHRPSEPYPREFLTVALPLTVPWIGTLRIPARMSPREWDTMMGVISLTRDAVVVDERASVEGSPR